MYFVIKCVLTYITITMGHRQSVVPNMQQFQYNKDVVAIFFVLDKLGSTHPLSFN